MSVRLTLLVFAVGALALGACGGDDDDGDGGGAPSDAAAVLADRVLRIGEEFGTDVEGRVGGLPPSLQLALNPDSASLIDSAVDEAGDRLAIIAAAAGLSTDEFAEQWRDDRAAAFARFAAGATEQSGDDETTPLSRLGLNELIALPVHPDGELVGSVHASRPSGEQLFFISYDVPVPDSAVEATLSG